MKKAMFILPVMMAFTLSGCALLDNIFKKNSSNNSQTSQQGSGSGSQQSGSGSQSGGQDIQPGDYTYSKSGSSLDGDKESSYSFTVGGVEFKFETGLLCSNNFDEFGLRADGTMTMKSLSPTLKIKKIVLDNYKYYNDCPLYVGENASGSSTTGSAAGADAENHNKVTWNNLDGAAYTYKNTYSGNSWVYSVTVTLG